MNVSTNRPGFLNDIAEILRLFLDLPSVTLAAELSPAAPGEAALELTLSQEQGAPCARARLLVCRGGAVEQYASAYTSPFAGATPLEVKRYEKRAAKIACFRAMGQAYSAPTPWGSLTGIRPTHLYRQLSQAHGTAAAQGLLLHHFDVSPGKLRLLQEISAVQAPILASVTDRDVDVYIGIPFCPSRCLYCSFLSQVRTPKTDMAAYLFALEQDISLGAALLSRSGYRLRALYVGGGTPTALTAAELHRLLSHALAAYHGFGREFTVEAGRPDSITGEKLRVLRGLGVTRICINPQTMNDETLTRIGRRHTAADVCRAFALARDLGFGDINMDLIAGLPGEGPGDMRASLAALYRLAPEAVTVHTLALKRASDLKRTLSGWVLPGAAAVEEMLGDAACAAGTMNLRPYYMYRQKYMRGNLENVGYAAPGRECLYNVDMMEEVVNVMAHGAGAMTKRVYGGEQRVERLPAPKDISAYCAKVSRLARDKERLFC